MIIFENIGKIFIDIILEGIINGFFRLIGKGLNKIGELFSGTEKKINRIKTLKKKVPL